MADVQTTSATGSASEEWEAFVLEERGIDYVPPADRHARPLDLFWTWAGSTANVLVFLYGAIVVFIGLSFTQAIFVIVLGGAAGWLLLGLGSLIGPNAGTGSLAAARAPFGINGNRFNALSNWVLVIGYEVADLAVIVLAGIALFNHAGIHTSDTLKVIVILLAVAIQLPLPLYGHATVVKSMRFLSVGLIAWFCVMAALLVSKVHPSALHQHAGMAGITAALALTLSGGGLGWVAYTADYSRYIPKEASKKAIFGWSALGAFISQTFLMILGAAVTTTVSGTGDLVGGLSQAFASWFVVPYLFLAIISLYAVNTIDLYSSGLNLQTIGVHIKRWQAVCVDLVICTVLLFFVIFSNRFLELLEDFILFGLVWIAPFVAIYLVDFALRRGHYDPVSLLRRTGGVYWRENGFNWAAVIPLLIGMFLAMMSISTTVYVGPIANRLGGSDWSIVIGGGAAGLLYLVFGGRRAVEEGKQTAAQEAELNREASQLVSHVTTD
jgi:NCS1 family nucleobase:cation symporter-1